jgi:hypothetical protein
MPTQFGGAGTGELMALQFLQKQKEDDRDFKLRQMQSYDQSRLDEQRIATQQLQNKKQEFELKQAQEEETSRKREASLLSTAFKASAPERLGANVLNANGALVNTYKKLGEDLATTNPKRAQEYFNKALDLESKIPEMEKKQLDLVQAKRQERTDSFADVSDQASWDVARTISANLGLPVPPQYKEYNQATKDWMANQNVFSKAGKIAADAALKEKLAKLAADKTAATIEDTKSKISARNANEQRKKDGLGTIKPVKQDYDSYTRERKYLEETSEAFSNVDSSIQGAIIQEIADRTQYLLDTKQTKDASVAKQMAREEVLKRVSPEGEYTPPSVTAETKPTGIITPTSKAEFDKLPSGTVYINPADGKQYRKK